MVAGVGAVVRAMIEHENDAEYPDGWPVAWVITRDRTKQLWDEQYPDDPQNDAQGIAGPSRSSAAASAGLANGAAIPFRIYDDGYVDDSAIVSRGDGDYEPVPSAVEKGHSDYGMLYEGLIYVEPRVAARWLWAPVDDFAQALGYTDIRYLDDGGKTWTSL